MLRGAAAAFVVLFVLPTALAGTETNPEIDDHPDQDRGELDLLAAWFENQFDGVRFTVKVAALQAVVPGYGYYVSWELQGRRYTAYLEYDTEGAVHSIVSEPGWGAEIPNAADYPDTLTNVDVRTGAPAYISATIPWGAAPGFEPGATMADLIAGTDDGRAGDGRDYVDLRSTENAFVAKRALVPSFAKSNPTAVLAGTALLGAAVAGGAFALVRRRRG